MDYPELIAELTDRTGESTVATRAKMHLTMAESVINKVLRVAENAASEILTTDTDGKATLPDDFQSVRMVVIAECEAQSLTFASVTLPHFLPRLTSHGYAIRGGQILTTAPNMDVTLYYYAKVPPLDETGSNWLIETDPEIYLYAMMRQVFMSKLDAEKSQAAQAIFDSLIAARIRADALARFASKPFRVAGNIA